MRVKKLISMVCLVSILLSCPAWAQDKAFKNSRYLDSYLKGLADFIPERRTPDGSFFIFGDEPTSLNFSRDEIQILVEKPFWQNLYQMIFHKKDYEQIQTLLEEYNRFYLSAVASGVLTLYPEVHFTNQGIFEEANARTFYKMFEVPDAGLGCDNGLFQYTIDTIKIDGDDAKVIITRSADVHDSGDGKSDTVIEENVREGYLLHKTEGEWKFENIIFDNSLFYQGDQDEMFDDKWGFNTFALFEESDDITVWRNAFTFAECQRKCYTPYGNYREYLQGEITAPTFDYERFSEEKTFSDP